MTTKFMPVHILHRVHSKRGARFTHSGTRLAYLLTHRVKILWFTTRHIVTNREVTKVVRGI